MGKKKKQPGRIGGRMQSARPDRAVVEALDQALRLKKQGQDAKAIELLEMIDRQHPGQHDVLVLLAECLWDTKDWVRHMEVAEELVQRFPEDADLNLMLAGAYLKCRYPILATHQFLICLARWPHHPRAAEVQATAAELAPQVNGFLAQMGQQGPDRMEFGVQHERIQVSLALGRYAEARRRAESFLQRWPRIPAVLNNLADASFEEGDIAAAIAAVRQSIEAQPENVHAWANLTRYLFLNGQIDEAREAGVRLAALPVQRPENWLKKAEAFSFLGDDEGVIAAWRGAEEDGFRLAPTARALLHHLGAVAFCRQGNEAEARRLWRLCRELLPNLTVAAQNLHDLDLPAGEKNGPWAHPLNSWLSLPALGGLAKKMTLAETQSFLRARPEIVRLVPPLFDRGDTASRALAIEVCRRMRTPELLALLRDFALGQRGPDKLRIDALLAARRLDAIPVGMVRMWIKGQWREQLILSSEITFEPMETFSHAPRVNQLNQEGVKANNEGEGWRGERLFREALELEPDAPDLQFNLAASYLLQGRQELAESIYRELHQKHPDYLFAAVEIARLYARAGAFDEAYQLLKPFINRPRLHVSEFNSLARANIELEMARNRPEGARPWLEMLERVLPDNPQLPALRSLVNHPRSASY